MTDHIPDAGKMVPRRIQRRRTKGGKMPPGAVYVGRPTMWGNPWEWRMVLDLMPDELGDATPADARGWVVDTYRDWLGPDGEDMPPPARADIRSDILRRIGELRGRDLVCWCRLDQPCHADVLLELANTPLRCEAA